MTEITQILRKERIIRNRLLFLVLARWRGSETRIQAGEYQFSNRMRPQEVLDKLLRGEQIKYSVIIPEGFTLAQTGALYQKMGLVDKSKFIQLSGDPEFIASLGLEGKTLEGYLFPDTYVFIKNVGEKNILRRMVARFKTIYGPFRTRAREMNLSQKEVITMASMIEKETGDVRERSLIAAVFYNRLKKKMRLESDPTVIYGLDNFNGDLTKKDLQKFSAYNTYVVFGLPPGPIANPGIDSIRAALYPAPVDYLYFVSKNDGTHQFSNTLREHQQAVMKYQKVPMKVNGT